MIGSLKLILSVPPELEQHKSRINQLKEENEFLQTSLQYAHAEMGDLKMRANDRESQTQKINYNQEWMNIELKELQRRHIKLD